MPFWHTVALETVQRFDFGAMGKPVKTSQGFLRVDANLTRVGVLVYKNADGSDRRELRLPEEVFNADSLSTLSLAPLTDMHPSEMVTSENVTRLQKGIVATEAKQDGRFVRAQLLIQDADLIKAIERGDRKELSPGYTCHLDATPGEWNGERYDAIQRGVAYNHIAIGPRGWARSGSEVALRTDGKDPTTLRLDGGCDEPTDEPNGDAPMKLITIKFDGGEFEVPEASAENVLALVKKREDSAAATLALVATKADTEAARADGLAKELETAKAALEAATDPVKVSALVEARGALETKARAIIGAGAKFDGKTEIEIKVDAIKSSDASFSAEGRSVDYINGRFDHLKPADVDAARAAEAQAATAAALLAARNDGAAPKLGAADQARAAMLERNAKAWKPTEASN